MGQFVPYGLGRLRWSKKHEFIHITKSAQGNFALSACNDHLHTLTHVLRKLAWCIWSRTFKGWGQVNERYTYIHTHIQWPNSFQCISSYVPSTSIGVQSVYILYIHYVEAIYGTAIRDHTLIDQHTNYLITLPVCTDKSFKYKLIIRIINKTTTHPLLSVYLFSVHILLYKQTNIYKPVWWCLHVLHMTYCMY